MKTKSVYARVPSALYHIIMQLLAVAFLASLCFVGINGHMFKPLFDYYENHANIQHAPIPYSDWPESDAITKTINCANQNEVSDKTIHEMIKRNKFLSTEVIKNFPSCIAKIFKLMNEDGSLSKAYIDNTEQLDKCKHLGGNDQNEVAAKMIECIITDGI